MLGFNVRLTRFLSGRSVNSQNFPAPRGRWQVSIAVCVGSKATVPRRSSVESDHCHVKVGALVVDISDRHNGLLGKSGMNKKSGSFSFKS